MGGNVNPAGQPPTRSTSGSSAPRPAAKRRLETGTVSFEFLPGGEVVNLDVDLHFAFCSSEAPGTSVPASEAAAPPAPKRRQATATQAAPPTAAPGPVVVHAEIHRAFGLGEQDEGMQ